MNKKILIIASVVVVFLLIGGYFILFTDDSTEVAGDKQLYTCGMHPEIISDEPGLCPICEMNLTPIQNDKKVDGEREILYWVAPMDPNEIYDEPGKSKMGMDLVPVNSDEVSGTGIVNIDPEVQQNMNIKTHIVETQSLNTKVVTNGVLVVDETNEYIVNTKVSGWVEELYINYTGQQVSKGQKLMEIYSPDLVAAQQELLTAISYFNSVSNSSLSEVKQSGNDLVENAERKLRLLDISENEIERIKQTGEVLTNLTLFSKRSGTVLSKEVVEGEKVMAGKTLLRIANLSTLWLEADIYEYELSKIKVGSKTYITFNYLPGKTFEGKLSFIYPTLDTKSRTVKVRVVVPNPKGELKPDMFANVVIDGRDLGVYPVIPENAVIRGGLQDIVIIALGNGKFKPQQVVLGEYSNGFYQVIEGLNEGTKIVTSAQFLIDSESNLKAAINQFQTTGNDTSMQKMNSNRETMIEDEQDYSSENISPLVRKEPIEVESIDENNDGKVYQDPMDWNVLSDEPGRCPLCNMVLEEVTIKEAKENLKEHGYQYK